MDQSENEAIQKRGANARAQNVSRFDNPFFKPDVMPASTGEDIADWNAKTEAWTMGWQIEDAMRI